MAEGVEEDDEECEGREDVEDEGVDGDGDKVRDAEEEDGGGWAEDEDV